MIPGSRVCQCGLQHAAIHSRRHLFTPPPFLYRHARRQLSILQRAVDLRVAAPPVKFDHSQTPDEVRSYLTKLGWEKAWIDGITERVIKMEFETSVSRVEAVVKYLEGLGIPTHWVCNMAARVPGILGRDPQSKLQPVVDYIQQQGVEGAALLQMLRDYPRLLLFDPSPDGKVLHHDLTRATVDVLHDQYRGRVANVSYWREGAAFETAPVSPLKPSTI